MKKNWHVVICFFFCFDSEIRAQESVSYPSSELEVIVVTLKIVWAILGSVGLCMIARSALDSSSHVDKTAKL